jgi:NAD(P)-dependent dehydrogenase (short-subunit alcohol dehydrogenase family)
VSGWRGLPKALAYGPTKAALINLAESLYFDLTDHGIGVSVVCPGYVDTPLTEQNDYKMPGLISAEQAARHIVDGWQRGSSRSTSPSASRAGSRRCRTGPTGCTSRPCAG